MSTDGALLGIEGPGGKAVFAIHVVAAVLLGLLGFAAIQAGRPLQALLMTAIAVMLLIMGRSAGRIVARR
jgi:hypothetical protein